jgi:hypothetical protein
VQNPEGLITNCNLQYKKNQLINVLTPQITGHNLQNKLGLIKFGNYDPTKKKIDTRGLLADTS